MEVIIHLFAVIIVLMTSMTASSMEHILVSDVAVLAVVEATRNVGSFPAYLPHQDRPWDQIGFAVVCVAVVWRTRMAFLVDLCTQRCFSIIFYLIISMNATMSEG